MFLEAKVAVITGAGRGIGRTIALALAKAGANVVAADLDLVQAEATAVAVQALGREAFAVKVDVSNGEQAEQMIEAAVSRFGRVDILVNNAGITRDNLLLRMKEIDWDLVMNVNLKGTYNCTKAVARLMLKQRSGKIVNLASVVGIMGNAGQSNYAASKAGVIGFTKSIARELAPRGVTVNAVAPGFIATDMTDVLPPEVKENFLRQIPLGRAGTAEDVAKVVLFLASPDADYLTGQVIHADGGMLM